MRRKNDAAFIALTIMFVAFGVLWLCFNWKFVL